MADKKEESKIVLEREYNIPLRRRFCILPRYQRTPKAVKAVREFLERHMKSEDVKLGKYINQLLWKHGINNPPHHISVTVKKDDKGVVYAELKGAPVANEKKAEEKKSEPKKEEDKVIESKPEVKDAEILAEKADKKPKKQPKEKKE